MSNEREPSPESSKEYDSASEESVFGPRAHTSDDGLYTQVRQRRRQALQLQCDRLLEFLSLYKPVSPPLA